MGLFLPKRPRDETVLSGSPLWASGGGAESGSGGGRGAPTAIKSVQLWLEKELKVADDGVSLSRTRLAQLSFRSMVYRQCTLG